MIELELFYNRAVLSVREAQAEYLKKQKSIPFQQELPEIEEVSAEEYAKMTFFQRLRYRRRLRKQIKRHKKALRAQKTPMNEQLTRGYNAGIEMALSALDLEFSAFLKRIEKEEN